MTPRIRTTQARQSQTTESKKPPIQRIFETAMQRAMTLQEKRYFHIAREKRKTGGN